jgi:hypothetical protein
MGGDTQPRKNKDYLPSGLGGSAASTFQPALDYDAGQMPQTRDRELIEALQRLGVFQLAQPPDTLWYNQ